MGTRIARDRQQQSQPSEDHRGERGERGPLNDGDATLEPAQLSAYFALMEVAALLRHGVEHQLRDVGDLSYVQFELLARPGLDSPSCSLCMTDLADGVVYTRSGLTYQPGCSKQAGLVQRAPSPDDERSVMLTITEAGRERLGGVLLGPVEVLQQLFLKPLSAHDVAALAALLIRCATTCAPVHHARPHPAVAPATPELAMPTLH